VYNFLDFLRCFHSFEKIKVKLGVRGVRVMSLADL